MGEPMRRLVRREVEHPAAHPVFRTHFPGFPRVPGSFLVQNFLDMLKGVVPEGQKLVLQRFRFRHFLAPGTYCYELEERADGGFSCRIWDGETLACEGIVRCPRP